MKKLINKPESIIAESLAGFEQAHRGIVKLGPDRAFVQRALAKHGKVVLVSGGGSGHEPLHVGFVGLGMLDAACPGQVFTSPTPDQILAAATAVDCGTGVLFIVKNYEGDVMNFDMAREMYEGNAAAVITNDDVAVENSIYTSGRRGVAGTLVVEKIAGAAAEAGADLGVLEVLGQKINRRTRSMSASGQKRIARHVRCMSAFS
jgi:dihydroxyacetone kinase-like protein